jgi:hypothetical protein
MLWRERISVSRHAPRTVFISDGSIQAGADSLVQLARSTLDGGQIW